MTYDQAEKLYGPLMRPIDAANKIGIKQPSINDYWKRGTLTRVNITIGGKEKSFVIISEVNRLILKREEKKAVATITKHPDGTVISHATSDGKATTIAHPDGKISAEAITLKAIENEH